MTQPVSLRYGTGHITLNLPDAADRLEGPAIPALPDAPVAVRQALAEPIGCAPLAERVRQRRPQSVAISISDITRPVPNQVILTALLEVLNAQGVRDEQCVIIVATGMHRPSTAEEIRIMLGDELPRRVEVIDHRADALDTVKKVSDDPPVSVNRRFLEADFQIVTGLIEPHFMAGFSGGRKGICPGLVDLATVSRFHGFGIMGDPNSVEGRLEGNPCHEESLRVARIVDPDFLVNVAITHDRRPAGFYAGDMEAAFDVGCRAVARWTSAPLDGTYDLVVTSAGGYPLDKNFYQTIKSMCTALPALHGESRLLVLSACEEVGEPAFVRLFDRFGSDWRAFLQHIETSGVTGKDQWQYQMMTRVLERIGRDRLLVAGDGLTSAAFDNLAVTPCPGPGDAAARAQAYLDDFATQHPGARLAVIPEGPYTMLAQVPAAVG